MVVTSRFCCRPQEALDVRERVLKALKERLIARANILQSRYDDEQQQLLRKQANYQRDRDIITREEEEKYEKECEEAMFRIKILEQVGGGAPGRGSCTPPAAAASLVLTRTSVPRHCSGSSGTRRSRWQSTTSSTSASGPTSDSRPCWRPSRAPRDAGG